MAPRVIALSLAVGAIVACDSNEPVIDSGDTLIGKGAFAFRANSDQPEIDVFYYVPRSRSVSSEVVIALHGNNRDAVGTRDEWVAKAEQYGALVFAPEFSDADFPRSSGYILGNVFENGNNPAGTRPRPGAEWAFSTIEPLFDEIQAQLDESFDSYELVGHSGGGQFVHRFVQFVPDGRYDRAIAANAGWYTLPDEDVFFPYGLEGSPVEGTPPTYFDRELIIMIGELDTDPNSAGLRHTPEADAQGVSRFERASFFMSESERLADAAGTSFAWTRREVSGVGHNGALMNQRAADLLFE